MNNITIKKILENYDNGEIKSLKQLKSGFHSDNYKIITSKEKFILRKIHEKEKDADYILKIYEYLSDNGINTATPIKTIDNKLFALYKNKIYAIQKFIEGKPQKSDKIDPKIYGKILGTIQKELSKINLKGREDLNCINIIKNLSKYMPDNNIIKQEYQNLQKEIDTLNKIKLTKSIINADCDTDDFLFYKNKFSGILDFGDSHPDYVLYDIATFLMYSGFYKDKNKYQEFIKEYLKEFNIPKKELECLKFFLKIRFFIQIFYHNYRYKEGIKQGLKSSKENLKGINEGKNMLKNILKLNNEFYKIE